MILVWHDCFSLGINSVFVMILFLINKLFLNASSESFFFVRLSLHLSSGLMLKSFHKLFKPASYSTNFIVILVWRDHFSLGIDSIVVMILFLISIFWMHPQKDFFLFESAFISCNNFSNLFLLFSYYYSYIYIEYFCYRSIGILASNCIQFEGSN